jgi:hypothetical protein
VAFWHPDFADDHPDDLDTIGRYVALLGPFLQTFPGLTVDGYWELSVSEHRAMLEWLYATEVIDRPKLPDGNDPS